MLEPGGDQCSLKSLLSTLRDDYSLLRERTGYWGSPALTSYQSHLDRRNSKWSAAFIQQMPSFYSVGFSPLIAT